LSKLFVCAEICARGRPRYSMEHGEGERGDEARERERERGPENPVLMPN